MINFKVLIHPQILSFKKTCQNLQKKKMYAKNKKNCQGFGKFLVAKKQHSRWQVLKNEKKTCKYLFIRKF